MLLHPKTGHAGMQSWIWIFHLGFSKTPSLNPFKSQGDPIFESNFLVKFLCEAVKFKTECHCCVLLKYPDRSLPYPAKCLTALGWCPVGDTYCRSRASIFTSLPTFQTAGYLLILGVMASSAPCQQTASTQKVKHGKLTYLQLKVKRKRRKHIKVFSYGFWPQYVTGVAESVTSLLQQWSFLGVPQRLHNCMMKLIGKHYILMCK